MVESGIFNIAVKATFQHIVIVSLCIELLNLLSSSRIKWQKYVFEALIELHIVLHANYLYRVLIVSFNAYVWQGFGAAWHLDHIEVRDASTGHTYMFPCGKWLSKSDDDKQICRELPCANMPSPTTKSKISYYIYFLATWFCYFCVKTLNYWNHLCI